MSDDTWPWYALQTKQTGTKAKDQISQFSQLQYQVECETIKAWMYIKTELFSPYKKSITSQINDRFSFCTAPGALRKKPSGGSTYFSNVTISRWPVYCHARRSARSLASELKFKGARVTLSYSVTTKHTGEAMDITSSSVTVWCFTSPHEVTPIYQCR